MRTLRRELGDVREMADCADCECFLAVVAGGSDGPGSDPAGAHSGGAGDCAPGCP